MPNQIDTLTLDGFRRDRELPIAAVESVNHPEAVAQARALIAALPETFPLETTSTVPSVASTELETNRQRLADTLRAEPEVKRPPLPSVVQPIITAIGIFLLMLVVFKSPVLISQIKYHFDKPAATSSSSTNQLAATTIIPAAPTITIPKINVQAPVIYEPNTDDASFQKALESGVVHYANTAVPGQNGNVAIFGHSSNDWWQPGNYKFVFVLLDKLVPGDKINIDYQSKRYTYEVTGSTVVEPTQVSVLDQTPTPTLTLITCTPPGTSWKRLVVTAKQIDPDPNAATATPAPVVAAGSQLSGEGASPSIFHQIGEAWSNFKHLFGGTEDATTSPSATPAPATLPASN